MHNETNIPNEEQTGRLQQPAVGSCVFIHFQVWAGRTPIAAQLVGETAKKYKVIFAPRVYLIDAIGSMIQ